ncbi:MAG: carboxypeptidase regulatory-like domain-containing protein [Methanobacteriota archaeon]|nr:MAG: carboxypeptidase regulatory-like domain-containing protein [Euryarchaeota archaeon]
MAQDEDIEIGVGTVLKPDGFNPFTMTTGISYTVLWITYDFLYTAGPDLEPYPQLAHSHSVSEDGLVWTYYLVEDALWHDGEPVTAHDANFTFNMMLRNEKECALLGGYLRNVTDVRALDDHTLQITTDITKSTMLSINVPILPEHYWSKVEADGMINKVDMWQEEYFPNGPIGSGPLILDAYSMSGGFIKLLKFEDYHMGPVNVDVVWFKIYNTEDGLVTGLTEGDIDVSFSVPPTHWEATLAEDDIEGQEINVLNMIDFGFNCASQELRLSETDGARNYPKASTNYDSCNLSIRKAAAMAINKTYIMNQAVDNHADMGDSMVPTATSFWHYDVPPEEEYQFDIAAANALLDASGYNRDDDGDGIRENETSGVELNFDFYYILQTLADEVAATSIAEWLEDIGINAPAQGVPEGLLYNMWFGLEYDLFIWNWQPDPDPSFILSVLTTDEIPVDWHDITAWSDVYYSNPEYDQLYLDQLKETDRSKRQEIVYEMQQIAYLDVPYVILYYPHDLIAYRTDRFMAESYPDMSTYPGKAPDWIWFYFEILPVGATINVPPSEVNAGSNRDCVVNQTLAFTGSATDENDPLDTLTWEWTFEYTGEESTRMGQSVEYKFENIGQVNVTLTVTDPGGLSGSDSLVVTVTPMAENSGWLVGYVKTGGGTPVVGAVVQADSIELDSVLQETNLTGYYEMNLVAGDWTVTAEKTGYSNDTGEISMIADETMWLNLTLNATTGNIKGTVIDLETDEPISGAMVKVTVGDNTKQFTSTDTGYFELMNLPAGIYSISATKNGYVANSTNVTVVAGESASAVIYLEPVAEEESAGLSPAAIAAIGIVLAILAAIVAMVLMKRRRKGASALDEPPPPDQESGPGE